MTDDEQRIDRITPTRRPSGLVVNRQKWDNLLFLHWAVPVSQLRPLVPSELTIDTFDGNAYVGLIPFTVRGARAPFLPPLPGVSTFHEVNVRTYVHYRGGDPGVWFFSLDATSKLAVRFARSFFHLPYRDASIRLTELHPRGSGFDYESRRTEGSDASLRVAYQPDDAPPRNATVKTLDHFLIERYVLYARDRSGLYRGRVHHKPYPIRDATVRMLDESLLAAARILRPGKAPIVHYSRGVDTEIFGLKKLG
jgi:uncharacterized protein YqjF (DUF2071 family)